MTTVTKIFRFEMAHAIHGYTGKCSNIHGHSYELHVTVQAKRNHQYFIPSPGFIIDFKELKQIVKNEVLSKLDHMLYLSKEGMNDFNLCGQHGNLVITDWEPSAENLLHFIHLRIANALPCGVCLQALKLYETADSYAEWRSSEVH